MSQLTFITGTKISTPPADCIVGKRHLTKDEIATLISNLNSSSDSKWQNIYVDEGDNFDAKLIKNSSFSGFVVIGRLIPATLKYHDLELATGIYSCNLCDTVINNDCALHNANIWNYRIGERVMIFNVQELSCTKHSKFGNGILKEGENEKVRVDIGVSNENGMRAILPFEKMIAADAYLWSRYRDDEDLMKRFKELTEADFSKENNTFGEIGNDAIIKNTILIKDTKVGSHAYIKGAFKIKNVTILSNEDEVSQIGEGVELVNGIVGYACHIFYQAVAVRFVIGRNCQLKYGARLLNSVLGDNSTVSCCELLNNLIFPFHEQHHNSSFLIATTVLGQSNIAAGATIGSNHNSRSPDGEIIAGRGFWPGLCTSFKHNSRFASFVLASKGDYQHELDIQYPFCLLIPGENNASPVKIIPAWWFMYDMFAIVRNKYKFNARDKRNTKIQNIETDPLAPDTMQEIECAIERLIDLTAMNLEKISPKRAKNAKTPQEIHQAAKDFLHQENDKVFTLEDNICQKKYGAIIQKPAKAYKMYRKIVKYFATRTLIEYCESTKQTNLNQSVLKDIRNIPLYTQWQNLGGQIVPQKKVEQLFELIKTRKITNWNQVHEFYNECQSQYLNYKAAYSLYLLENLYSSKIEDFSHATFKDILADVIIVSNEMYNSSVSSRKKDFTDYYRCMVYRNSQEMNSVLGTIDEIPFLDTLKKDTENFNKKLKNLFDCTR